MIEAASDKTILVVEKLAVFLLWALVGLILYDASMRYFFHIGAMQIQELQWHFFDVIMLLSVSITLRHKGHVRVDIFYQHFTPRTQMLIDLAAALFLMIPFSLLVIVVSGSFIEMSFIQMEGSADPGGLPYRFLVKSMMAVGFIFLGLQALKDAVILVKALRS